MKPKKRKEKLIIMTLLRYSHPTPACTLLTLLSFKANQVISHPATLWITSIRSRAHSAERYKCQKQGRWAATLANALLRLVYTDPSHPSPLEDIKSKKTPLFP